MASNTKAAENDSPAGVSNMWKTFSRAGEFKGETPNAQRRTPNIGPECCSLRCPQRIVVRGRTRGCALRTAYTTAFFVTGC